MTTKSEPGFTPGPWILVDGWPGEMEKKVTTDKRDDSATVAICQMDVEFTGEVGEEQEANANLIAAAPELYEALAGLYEIHSSPMSLYGKSKPYDDARAALAKARGEHHEK